MSDPLRLLASLLVCATLAPCQRWQETCGRTDAGVLAVHQAARDARADALVLLVASHPDDRYILPAVWLRSTFGYRVAVLLATRGGGGQNSLGPETGDAFERIRTLETEAGCALVGAQAWYLNCPDGGFRRSAEETYAEWGRTRTRKELVRLLRTIRPDAVITTHNEEEAHGHDLALVELLREAVDLAGDGQFESPGAPHDIPVFLVGAGSTVTPDVVEIDAEYLDPDRGAALRRTAYEVLGGAHVSPGPPNHIDAVFGPVLRFEPVKPAKVSAAGPRALGLPSVLDAGRWPGAPERAREIEQFLAEDLPAELHSETPPIERLVALITELRSLRDSVPADDGPDVVARLGRRIQALERLTLALSQVQIVVETVAGTVAVAGEEFSCSVRALTGRETVPPIRATGLDGIEVDLISLGDQPKPATNRTFEARVRIPLPAKVASDPMSARFHADRFTPPVRIRFHVSIGGIEVPVDVTVPVEQRAPVELEVVPRMLLLPSARNTLQFSVRVIRNTRYPVRGTLDVRAPAGYAIANDSYRIDLRNERSELFGFDIEAPRNRRNGVSELSIRLGGTRITLPVHKVDVRVPTDLHIGVLRSQDDTLASILGVGGLGLRWSELTDADIAAADLGSFDTIAVDIRALRNRPGARQGFRRLLDFANQRGHRLVIFYQKDIEFHPVGERFRGAPFEPFQIRKNRVTRADAPVNVLLGDHVLMTSPNVIRPNDWDDWVQERALYLPGLYAPEYEEVLEVSDPGQPAERGALLYARSGDGEYVYCALALWRQLKKLHPGAVRMLLNLLTPMGHEAGR